MSMSARAQRDFSRYAELIGTGEAFLDDNVSVGVSPVALTAFFTQARLDEARAVVIYCNAGAVVVRYTGDNPNGAATLGKIRPEGSEFVVQGADIGNLRMVYNTDSRAGETTALVHIELRR